MVVAAVAVAVLVVRLVSSECRRYHNDEASWVVHPSFYYPAGNCAVCVVLAAAIIAAAAVAAVAVVAGAIIAGAGAVLLAVALVVAVCLPHRF